MNYFIEKSTNISYGFQRTMAKNPKLEKLNDYVVILGKKFKLKIMDDKKLLNEKIKQNIQSIPWFTYRKNFKPMDKNLQSDTGWGCMIRTGQTLVFLMLREFLLNGYQIELFILKHFFNEKREYIEKLEQNELGFYVKKMVTFDQYIPSSEKINLLMLNQMKKQQFEQYDLFSLQNIVNIAEKNFQLEKGQWFNPSLFLDCIEILIKQNFKNLEVQIVRNNIFQIDTFYEKVGLRQNQNYNSKEQYIEELKNKKWYNQVLLSFCMQLGSKKLEQRYRNLFNIFCDCQSNIGTLSSIGNKAIIIIGRHNNNKYYYMDPHYVQESNDLSKKTLVELRKEYFHQSNKQILSANYEDLNGQVVFCFFIKSQYYFTDLMKRIQYLQKNMKQEFFLSLQIQKLQNQKLQTKDFVDDFIVLNQFFKLQQIKLVCFLCNFQIFQCRQILYPLFLLNQQLFFQLFLLILLFFFKTSYKPQQPTNIIFNSFKKLIPSIKRRYKYHPRYYFCNYPHENSSQH